MSANLSNASHNPLLYQCFDSTMAFLIFTMYIMVKAVLLLPLSALILYLGHRLWRRQRSFKTTSHSAIFTYHLVTVEMISIIGNFLVICFTFVKLPLVAQVIFYVSSMVLPGEMLFHCLTCVDRYLAAVHPVTYMGLRHGGGARIRNISIGCVWLLGFGWTGVTVLHAPELPIFEILSILVFSLVVVSFCSLSTLCSLIGSSPGRRGGDHRQVVQSKQRAFYTILSILGALWVWFVGLLVSVSLNSSTALSYDDRCLALIFGICTCLPASLVSPLLFLHREGKLKKICHQSSQQ